MNLVLPLSFFALGVAIIVNAFMTPAFSGLEFPRYGVTPLRSRRLWLVTIGVGIAIGGLALLLLSRAEPW